MPWSSYDIHQDGQTDWLVRLYEKTINGVRELGGLPSEDEGTFTVALPTIGSMAEVMRFRQQLPPGHNVPSGVIA